MYTDGLYISIRGRKSDEKCNILFTPSKRNIKVISWAEHDVTYDLNHSGKAPVPFTLNITARTVIERTINNFLDLDFEGNDAGPQLLQPCDIKNFQNLQKITIKGIHHLRGLLFEYDKHIY
ncbi:unnamed protein product [Danaus chrysippus]|uniref:(African queen) hypothetical protein n=1 Tax=Danaus chrysippus TaxID=151541 RepID=A0A8J2VPR8_9NEOP|nr:unnamed protein product [Danaus chrysippus]